MKRMTFTNWVSLAGIAILVVGNIWTLSSELPSIRHRLDRLDEKVGDLTNEVEAVKVNSDKIPLIELRMDNLENRMGVLENRMDGLENRMGAVEKKLKP